MPRTVTMVSSAARNYLITGAGRGIGRGLSRLLLQRGHRVFLIDNNEEELSNTASLLSKSHNAGQDFDTVVCNVRVPSEITAAVNKARHLFAGHLDCLVNNAACKSFEEDEHLCMLNPTCFRYRRCWRTASV